MSKNVFYSLMRIVLLMFVIYSCSEDEPIQTQTPEVEEPVTEITETENPDTNTPSDFHQYEFIEPQVTGNSYYIDPVNGSAEGDGSENSPWKTLQQVIDDGLIQYYKRSDVNDPNSLVFVNEDAPVKEGDELILRDGYHGNISLQNFTFIEGWLTIRGQNNEAVLSQFKIIGAFKNVYLKNFKIIKDSFEGDGNYWEAEVLNKNATGSMIHLSSGYWGDGSNLKLNNITIKTTENANSWTVRDWLDKSASGITLRTVEEIEIYNCTLENLDSGMNFSYLADNCKAISNKILNFSHDGVRIDSNNLDFNYNQIIGCIYVDSELPEYRHHDGIQGWSRGDDGGTGGGTLKNVTLRGNLIVMGAPGDDNPGKLQAIGCFDGFFENWTVENNIIFTDNYHGIALYGLIDGKVLNNTVLAQDTGYDRTPWIEIESHKSRGPSRNSIIANNIVSRSVNVNEEGENIRVENNYVLTSEQTYSLMYEIFIDPDNFDFRLKDNEITRENIIDKGQYIEGSESSSFDLNGNARDEVPDIGAFEL